MKFKLEASCGCNTGRIRGNNEDNFYFDKRILPSDNTALKSVVTASYDENARETFFAVFDGMGGEAEGQIASFLAASVFKEACQKLEDYVIPTKQFLEDVVCRMNDAVWKHAEANFNHMGTTAVVLDFLEDQVYVCNVGDSKAFRLRESEFLQISKDHTDEQFLREKGITGRKPRLSQYVGVSPEEMVPEPYVAKGKLEECDQYLICSDGLTDMVSNVEICEILKSSDTARDAVELLIKAALEHGGRDNVTVILVRVK